MCQGSPYTDDCLASKKILPKYNHKAAKTPKHSPWQSRLINTDSSLLLLFKMVHAQWAAVSGHMTMARKPLSRQVLEEKGEVAALACYLPY